MRFNIIKEYRKERKKTDDALMGNIDSDESYEVLADKLGLLDEILEYINSYEWVRHKKVKNKIKCFIESDFNYDIFCKKFGISYTSARNSCKYAYKMLVKCLGANTLSLIKKGMIDEARSAFYISSGKFSKEKFLTKSLIEILPEPEFTASLSFEDCHNELMILSNMSMWRLEYYKGVMNKDNMAYLLHLLEGSSKRADLFRPYIISFLTNKISYEELLKAEADIVENKLN